ncbi:SPASM domain-containing protein [Pararhodobacter sp. CCB-MM2]|uniref:SPASM domain-containing protein n=1 Tax=Pararhodobacter sp. CCB-MM2 TaxID=1786003 RepID=UPI0009F5672C|nr:SPASM domain-containing protein [Pararhodobacter sp. CCB-MM2]
MDNETPEETLDRCPYFHRTAVIMVDGEVVSCANFYAESIGKLGNEGNLPEIWNNDRFQDLRQSFGTINEWSQCKSCWFREAGYARQRDEWHSGLAPNVEAKSTYSERAWDFTRFLKGGR